MFTKVITGLTLTNQVADSLFNNINGLRYMGDESFLATLRALMYKRVPKGESIWLGNSTSRFAGYELNGAKPKDCVKAFLRGTDILEGGHGILHIHSFNGTEEGNSASFAILDNGGLNACISDADFTYMPDISKFLEQSGKIRNRVFISEKRKITVIFAECLDVKRYHLLQSLIPRYLPWYVSENPFDEEEVALLRSLTKRYSPEYCELIEAFTKRFDFRTQSIRNVLRGFENGFEQEKLNQVRNQITNARQQIEVLDRKFRETYTLISDLTTQELGLVAKIRDGSDNEEDTELIEYFLCNKSLNIVRASRGEIEFVVTTTISNYDPEVAERALDKVGRSFFYRTYDTGARYQNTEMTDERIYRLIKALFVDEILKLRVCAAYRLNFADGGYRGLRAYEFGESILKSYTPNQHIQRFACLGNNEQIIRKAMLNRDYVAAITACCASAANANLTESNTGTYLMQRLFANDIGAVIQMPDGSTATPLDAVRWLEAREEEKKKKEEANE